MANLSLQLQEGTHQENNVETEYLQTIGDAGQSPYSQSYKEPSYQRQGSVDQATSAGGGSKGEGEDNAAEGAEEVQFTTKWENASGQWFKL